MNVNLLDLLDDIPSQQIQPQANISFNPFDNQAPKVPLNSSQNKGTTNTFAINSAFGSQSNKSNNPFAFPANFNPETKENFNVQQYGRVSGTQPNQFANQALNKPNASTLGNSKQAGGFDFSDWNNFSSGQTNKPSNPFENQSWGVNQQPKAMQTNTNLGAQQTKPKSDFGSFSASNFGWDSWSTPVQKVGSFGGTAVNLTESRNLLDCLPNNVAKPQTNFPQNATKRQIEILNIKNEAFKVNIESTMENKSCLEEIFKAISDKAPEGEFFFENEKGERIEPKEALVKMINSTGEKYFFLKNIDLHAFFDEEDRNKKIKMEVDPFGHYEMQEALRSLVEGRTKKNKKF
jgi:hypothetical protein